MENNKKPDAENLLQVCDIYKSFGDNAVLKGMTLSLASGEVLSLIGGNGAGKKYLNENHYGYLYTRQWKSHCKWKRNDSRKNNRSVIQRCLHGTTGTIAFP